MSAELPTPSLSASKPGSNSVATSPDSAKLTTPSEIRDNNATPKPESEVKKEPEGAKPRTKMPPPPLPINIVKSTP